MNNIIVDFGGVLIPNNIVVVLDTSEFDDLEAYVAQLSFVKGDSGGSYEHIQSVAASTWTITHNLGYRPGGIQVFDSGGEQWFGVVEHIDVNSLTIDFGAAIFGGTAYIS